MKSSEPIVKPASEASARGLGPGFLLVQDNAQHHMSMVCKQYLDYKDIDVTDLPSWFPDLKPIKTLGDSMYQHIRRLPRSSLMP